jgi:membrane associated rhomboid family serine protease
MSFEPESPDTSPRDARSGTGESADDRAVAPGDVTFGAKVGYYFLAFFAYWFGAGRFDMDDDGDFDAADVQAMLNKGKGLMRMNFSRPPRNQKARAARRRRREAKRRQKMAEEEESDRAHKEIVAMNAEAGGISGAAAGALEGVLHGAEILGRKADGVLDAEVEDDAQEDEIIENLKQYLPYFTIIEALLCLGLWGVCAFYASGYTSANTPYFYAMTDDFILTKYVADEGSTLYLDACKNECNNADSACVGIGWKRGPFPDCYLLRALPTTGISSPCATATWGLVVYEKEAWGPANSMFLKGGAESIFPGYTILQSHSYCEEGYDISFLWRWWSYQFTHGSITHAGSNCFMLVMLGIPLEGYQGTGHFAIMWTIGVFGGACCWALFDPYRSSYGASGGCYSLLGMHVADLIMNWGDKKWRFCTMLVLALVAGIESAAYWATMDEESNTAHTVHVGGVVAGLLIGFVGGRNDNWKCWEYIITGAAWLLAFVLVIGSVGFWFFLNEFPAIRNLWDFSERPWCWIGYVCIGDDGNHCPLLDSWTSYTTGAVSPEYDNTLQQCVFCNTRACVEGWFNDKYTIGNTENYKYCPQDSSNSLCTDFGDDWDLFYPPDKSAYQ